MKKLHEYQCVLFDLDGTLVDSLPDIEYAVRQMESEFHLPPVTSDQIRNWIGNGASVLVKRVLARNIDANYLGDDYEHVLAVFMHHYQHIPEKKTKLYPGAIQLLESLKSKNIKLALVTNKPGEITRMLLTRLRIDIYFDVVLGGGDVAELKPSPMMIEKVLSLLSCSTGQAVMIGDSKNDIEAAKRALVSCIGVEGGYNHGRPIQRCEPDLVVSNLESLITLI